MINSENIYEVRQLRDIFFVLAWKEVFMFILFILKRQKFSLVEQEDKKTLRGQEDLPLQ